MFKQSELIKRLDSQVGTRVDFDGYYGSQCVDLIMDYIWYLTGTKTWGNAIDYTRNSLPSGFTRHKPGEITPQFGDILVFGFAMPYGHIGIVKSWNGNYFETYEANVDGGSGWLTIGGPVRVKTNRDMSQVVAIIRPNCIEVDKVKSEEYPLVPEQWRFTVTVPLLNVRNKPSTKNSDVVAQYNQGELINYDGYIIRDGYVWISYVSNSGERRYVASSEYQNGKFLARYGHFK